MRVKRPPRSARLIARQHFPVSTFSSFAVHCLKMGNICEALDSAVSGSTKRPFGTAECESKTQQMHAQLLYRISTLHLDGHPKNGPTVRANSLVAWTRQVSLPAGPRPLDFSPSGVPAAACQSLLQGRARSAAYARRSVHAAAASFFLESRLDGRWHAMAREPAARIFFPRRTTGNGVLFFSVDSGSGGLCCQFLWHAGPPSERASPVNAHRAMVVHCMRAALSGA